MKFRIYLLASVFFLLFSAMSCENILETSKPEARLVAIELTNLDYSEKELDSTLIQLKKETYAIGVCYKVMSGNLVTDTSSYWYNASWNRTPRIITLTDFSDQYPAGSDVSECFTVSSQIHPPYDLLLVMRQFPIKGTHIFNVKFKCFDGTTVESKTKPVSLY